MTRRKRRTYTAEQKADAVRLVKENGSLPTVAKDLELTESALRNWVVQARAGKDKPKEDPLTTSERDELKRLRRETKILRQERDFLKKAAAFFARDQDERTR